MRKNKKKRQVNAFVFSVPYAGVVVLITTLALVYVWLGCRCESLGARIVSLEGAKRAVDDQYYNEKCRWARMKSPVNIERALVKNNIVMQVPQKNQVVWLRDLDLFDNQMDVQKDGILRFAKLEKVVGNEGK